MERRAGKVRGGECAGAARGDETVAGQGGRGRREGSKCERLRRKKRHVERRPGSSLPQASLAERPVAVRDPHIGFVHRSVKCLQALGVGNGW